MLEWALIIGTGLVAGAAIALLVRRELVLCGWLKGEMTGLRDQVDQACLEMRTMGDYQSDDALDSVEGEEFEISSNLDRMNLLLDRLNGLLRGKTDSHEGRRVFFREERRQRPGGLDFASPEEIRKFTHLPPLSDEEIQSIDWERLFDRLRSDEAQ